MHAAAPFRRVRFLILSAMILTLVAVDLRQPPAHQETSRVLVAGIHAYQRTLSRWMPVIGISCRFEPSCSRYAEASIQRHGALHGSWQAFRRLLRCGPWTPPGTLDPPRS